MHFPRSSGILLHPTSLPGRYGIGDFGTAAYQFVDFLADAGQRLWQILPLVPTGYGNSPYQSPSAFAGNPLLISLDRLIDDGLLTSEDVPTIPEAFAIEDRVNYEAVSTFKMPLLQRAFERFRSQKPATHTAGFAEFCEARADWLDDYALFLAIKEQHKGESWNTWERDTVLRKATALKKWKKTLADQIEMHKFFQYLFSSQWQQLKDYANSRNIQIIGDMPLYVSYDSAEVWAQPELFTLDAARNPAVVAGVPPDYFSATGQRWGNPLYRWDKMEKNGFTWWLSRMKNTLAQVDIVRIDHFLGLESYWEIPAEEETAVNGRWVKAPGERFFQKMREELGDLPIIAEDLGLVTPAVEKLRDQFDLPGMKVLHFAFGGDTTNPYLPHNYTSNFVVYTGTHDNNTTIGWFASLGDQEREAVQCYLGRDGSDIAWELMRLALASVAAISIVPMQDVLRLSSEDRMNMPGSPTGNWEWRMRPDVLNPGLAQGLKVLTTCYGRGSE
jgi:4-alpha-glucanotransferase